MENTLLEQAVLPFMTVEAPVETPVTVRPPKCRTCEILLSSKYGAGGNGIECGYCLNLRKNG